MGAPAVHEPAPAATDLTGQLVAQSIDVAVVVQALRERRTRRYIGASGIGTECEAYQALSMRGFPSDLPEPQTLRIFRDGHRIKNMVVADLIAAGHKVEAVDRATGGQCAPRCVRRTRVCGSRAVRMRELWITALFSSRRVACARAQQTAQNEVD